MTKYYALINPENKVYDVFADMEKLEDFIDKCVNPEKRGLWTIRILGFAPCLHCVGCQEGIPSDFCPQAVNHGGPPEWMKYLGEQING